MSLNHLASQCAALEQDPTLKDRASDEKKQQAFIWTIADLKSSIETLRIFTLVCDWRTVSLLPELSVFIYNLLISSRGIGDAALQINIGSIVVPFHLTSKHTESDALTSPGLI